MLKRAVTEINHTITVKHLQSYIDELAFKFNHKFDECLFTSLTLRRLDIKNCPYLRNIPLVGIRNTTYNFSKLINSTVQTR
jgi:hypothetical protein